MLHHSLILLVVVQATFADYATLIRQKREPDEDYLDTNVPLHPAGVASEVEASSNEEVFQALLRKPNDGLSKSQHVEKRNSETQQQNDPFEKLKDFFDDLKKRSVEEDDLPHQEDTTHHEEEDTSHDDSISMYKRADNEKLRNRLAEIEPTSGSGSASDLESSGQSGSGAFDEEITNLDEKFDKLFSSDHSEDTEGVWKKSKRSMEESQPFEGLPVSLAINEVQLSRENPRVKILQREARGKQIDDIPLPFNKIQDTPQDTVTSLQDTDTLSIEKRASPVFERLFPYKEFKTLEMFKRELGKEKFNKLRVIDEAKAKSLFDDQEGKFLQSVKQDGIYYDSRSRRFLISAKAEKENDQTNFQLNADELPQLSKKDTNTNTTRLEAVNQQINNIKNMGNVSDNPIAAVHQQLREALTPLVQFAQSMNSTLSASQSNAEAHVQSENLTLQYTSNTNESLPDASAQQILSNETINSESLLTNNQTTPYNQSVDTPPQNVTASFDQPAANNLTAAETANFEKVQQNVTTAAQDTNIRPLLNVSYNQYTLGINASEPRDSHVQLNITSSNSTINGVNVPVQLTINNQTLLPSNRTFDTQIDNRTLDFSNQTLSSESNQSVAPAETSVLQNDTPINVTLTRDQASLLESTLEKAMQTLGNLPSNADLQNLTTGEVSNRKNATVAGRNETAAGVEKTKRHSETPGGIGKTKRDVEQLFTNFIQHSRQHKGHHKRKLRINKREILSDGNPDVDMEMGGTGEELEDEVKIETPKQKRSVAVKEIMGKPLDMSNSFVGIWSGLGTEPEFVPGLFKHDYVGPETERAKKIEKRESEPSTTVSMKRISKQQYDLIRNTRHEAPSHPMERRDSLNERRPVLREGLYKRDVIPVVDDFEEQSESKQIEMGSLGSMNLHVRERRKTEIKSKRSAKEMDVARLFNDSSINHPTKATVDGKVIFAFDEVKELMPTRRFYSKEEARLSPELLPIVAPVQSETRSDIPIPTEEHPKIAPAINGKTSVEEVLPPKTGFEVDKELAESMVLGERKDVLAARPIKVEFETNLKFNHEPQGRSDVNKEPKIINNQKNKKLGKAQMAQLHSDEVKNKYVQLLKWANNKPDSSENGRDAMETEKEIQRVSDQLAESDIELEKLKNGGANVEGHYTPDSAYLARKLQEKQSQESSENARNKDEKFKKLQENILEEQEQYKKLVLEQRKEYQSRMNNDNPFMPPQIPSEIMVPMGSNLQEPNKPKVDLPPQYPVENRHQVEGMPPNAPPTIGSFVPLMGSEESSSQEKAHVQQTLENFERVHSVSPLEQQNMPPQMNRPGPPMQTHQSTQLHQPTQPHQPTSLEEFEAMHADNATQLLRMTPPVQEHFDRVHDLHAIGQHNNQTNSPQQPSNNPALPEQPSSNQVTPQQLLNNQTTSSIPPIFTTPVTLSKATPLSRQPPPELFRMTPNAQEHFDRVHDLHSLDNITKELFTTTTTTPKPPLAITTTKLPFFSTPPQAIDTKVTQDTTVNKPPSLLATTHATPSPAPTVGMFNNTIEGLRNQSHIPTTNTTTQPSTFGNHTLIALLQKAFANTTTTFMNTTTTPLPFTVDMSFQPKKLNKTIPPTPGENGYVGCYADHLEHGRDLPVRAGVPFVTPTNCRLACKKTGYRYAGLQYGYLCFCGNTYGKYDEVPPSECDIVCSGNNSHTCGGLWRNKVYDTENVKEDSSEEGPIPVYIPPREKYHMRAIGAQTRSEIPLRPVTFPPLNTTTNETMETGQQILLKAQRAEMLDMSALRQINRIMTQPTPFYETNNNETVTNATVAYGNNTNNNEGEELQTFAYLHPQPEIENEREMQHSPVLPLKIEPGTHLFRGEIVLKQAWYSDLANFNSTKFLILSGNIEQAVKNMFTNDSSFLKTEVMSLSEISNHIPRKTLADFTMTFLENKPAAEVADGLFGSVYQTSRLDDMPVLPKTLRLKEYFFDASAQAHIAQEIRWSPSNLTTPTTPSTLPYLSTPQLYAQAYIAPAPYTPPASYIAPQPYTATDAVQQPPSIQATDIQVQTYPMQPENLPGGVNRAVATRVLPAPASAVNELNNYMSAQARNVITNAQSVPAKKKVPYVLRMFFWKDMLARKKREDNLDELQKYKEKSKKTITFKSALPVRERRSEVNDGEGSTIDDQESSTSSPQKSEDTSSAGPQKSMRINREVRSQADEWPTKYKSDSNKRQLKIETIKRTKRVVSEKEQNARELETEDFSVFFEENRQNQRLSKRFKGSQDNVLKNSTSVGEVPHLRRNH